MQNGENNMKLWIDDIREPPEQWAWAKTAGDAKVILSTGSIETVSFDNDLGPNSQEGWEVMNWLEEKVFLGIIPAPKAITIHSANIPAKRRMQMAALKILTGRP